MTCYYYSLSCSFTEQSSPHQHKTNVREGTDGQSCTCTPIFRVATTPLAEPEMREITLLPSFDKQKGKVCNSNTDNTNYTDKEHQCYIRSVGL